MDKNISVSVELEKLLKESGIRRYEPDESGQTILHTMSANGQRLDNSLGRRLVNSCDRKENTPLHLAASYFPMRGRAERQKEYSETIQLLIKNGARINAVNQDMMTPIFSFIHSPILFIPSPEAVNFVKILMQAGAVAGTMSVEKFAFYFQRFSDSTLLLQWLLDTAHVPDSKMLQNWESFYPHLAISFMNPVDLSPVLSLGDKVRGDEIGHSHVKATCIYGLQKLNITPPSSQHTNIRNLISSAIYNGVQLDRQYSAACAGHGVDLIKCVSSHVPSHPQPHSLSSLTRISIRRLLGWNILPKLRRLDEETSLPSILLSYLMLEDGVTTSRRESNIFNFI